MSLMLVSEQYFSKGHGKSGVKDLKIYMMPDSWFLMKRSTQMLNCKFGWENQWINIKTNGQTNDSMGE